MPSKNYKVSISTTADTSGAEAAEEALKRVGEAGENDAQAAAFERADEAARQLGEGIEELEEGLQELGDTAGRANEEGVALDENVSRIARAQKAQVLAQIADGVGKIGAEFKEAADEVREFDEDLADTLQTTGESIEQVTGAVSQLALGFAVGGPLGAGIAGIGVLVGGLANEYKKVQIEALRAAAAEREALDELKQASADATAAAEARASAIANKEIEEGLRAQLGLLREATDEIDAQVSAARQLRREKEEVLESEDRLALAKADKAEERGDITPEQAEQRRGEIEQAARVRKREERKKQAREDAAAAQEKRDKALQAELSGREKADSLRGDERAAEGSVSSAEAELEKVNRLEVQLAGARKDLADINALALPNLEQFTAAKDRLAAAEERSAAAPKTKAELVSGLDAANEELDRIRKLRSAAEEEAGSLRSNALGAVEESNLQDQRATRVGNIVDRVGANDDAARESRTRTSALADRNRAAVQAQSQRESAAARELRNAASSLREGASGSGLSELSGAVGELAAASKNMDAASRVELDKLAKELKNVAGRLTRMERR